jgi:serine phosphatase RsbU (regulator of sigma subunit)
MLPKILPELPGLQLAAYMKTATEVGGDYYDFHISDKGILSVVLGDATGHGMKAGTMVTAAKSLFNSHAPNPDIKSSFQEMNRNIKAMNFSRLAMCLTMLKIRNGSLSLSTAGMPPVFIFRANTGVIDEYLLKGMPLGSIKDFSYKTAETTLERGDAILLTTDGFPESQNIKRESYGYDRVKEVFQAAAHKAPDGIIDELKRAISEWAVQTEPEDDLTFVVIKKA